MSSVPPYLARYLDGHLLAASAEHFDVMIPIALHNSRRSLLCTDDFLSMSYYLSYCPSHYFAVI